VALKVASITMSLRDATPADLPVVGELIRGLADYERLSHEVVWTEEQLAEGLFGSGATTQITLAVDDATGSVAGFALWFPTFSTFLGQRGIWLEDLFVRPEFRGHGFGIELLRDLRRRTEGRVEWMVLDWNEPSIRFYESLGARPVKEWTRFRWLLNDHEPGTAPL
jgi:GNAT superfamily N-acetyltransferase